MLRSNDQVHVLVRKQDYRLDPLSTWDTLGFRGTCSAGFQLTAAGSVDQILPVPFEDILSQTMHPFSHIVWASLWSGIAADAVNRRVHSSGPRRGRILALCRRRRSASPKSTACCRRCATPSRRR